MRKRISFSLAVLAILCLGAAFALGFYKELGRWVLGSALNRAGKEFFGDSLQIAEVSVDRNLRIRLRRLRGEFQSQAGPVPIAARSIESSGPLFRAFSKEGLALRFDGIAPENSDHQGISGLARLRFGRKWSLGLEADIQSLDLGEIDWLSPENLSGSRGEMRGEIYLETDSDGKILLRARISIQEPGGRLPARFFEALTPYLPQLATRERVQEISKGGGWVGFRDAALTADLAEPDKMKVFLHILVPDYNLDLNVNLEIRLDEKNAFSRLFQLMGLMKGQDIG